MSVAPRNIAGLLPANLVDEKWLGRQSFPPLPARQEHLLADWLSGDKVFLSVASDALRGDCKRFLRHSTNLGVPHNLRNNPDARAQNRTRRLMDHGVHRAKPWHLIAAKALMALIDLALAVRVFCGALTMRCAEYLGSFGASWCLFKRKLRVAARMLPKAGLVVSAFNASVASILQEEFPADLMLPVTALANGKLSMAIGLMLVENVTSVYTEYLEFAHLLGQEMLRFGDGRVERATFHGDAITAGVPHGRIFRADVLLWVLGGGDGGPPSSLEPRVAEVGVDRGECSAYMLEGHAALNWFGVDIYEDGIVDPVSGSVSEDGRLLRIAKARLKPWLGTRAQLLISSSLEAASLLQKETFDLVFVDAAHSKEAAAADIVAWTPLVRPGGVLAGHDYCAYFDGVVEAANAALPRGQVLHLAPDMVFWWRKPDGGTQQERRVPQEAGVERDRFE